MTAQRTLGPGPLAGFYALYFMTVGISLPFLPGYFEASGFSPSQIGVLLAIGPACALFAPPVWGQLADRTGRPGLVLAIVSAGAASGFALLALAPSFPAAFGALVVQSLFSSAISTLIDTLALHQVGLKGGSYARLRVFGSLGFVVSSMGFGLVVTGYGLATVLLPLGLLTTAALWASTFLAGAPRVRQDGPRPTVRAAFELLRRREIALFLLATSLHWIACTPYHGSLALYVKALGFAPVVVSLSAGVAVLAEVAVMWTWPRWSSAVSPRGLLVWCFAASSLRWAIMAWTTHAEVLVAAALLHGLTFGAFYLASVAWMAERTPASLRATGQALFVACTFGVGGLFGYTSAGRAFEVLGGSRLFSVAAALEWLPVLALLALSASSRLPAPQPGRE
ncbi:MAG: MFS transporter [Myxococcota bacterium]